MLIKNNRNYISHVSSRLSFFRNGLDRRVWHPFPLGCLWFTDKVYQVNLLQIRVESILTTTFRLADSSTSCWLRDLIKQKQNKAPFISLHTMCSCNFGRIETIMKLSLELHWNFLKNRFRILVGFCIISFKKANRQLEREKDRERESSNWGQISFIAS